MPLNYTHQMELLRDLLEDHQLDCCGSVSEYEQIERVVQSLLANDNVNQEIKAILEQIYVYGQKGKNTNNSTSHIEMHQNQLSQWVEEIDQTYF